MRKPSATSRSKPRANDRARKVSREKKKSTSVTTPDSQVSTARAATEDELAAIARSQQGQHSAESFWKAAGRFTKLR